MHCPNCPADRRQACLSQGCHNVLAELRSATLAGAAPISLLDRLLPGAVLRLPADPIDLQVRRLDVEDNDILVVRTAEKLSQEKSDAFHDRVLELAQRHGVKGVTVVVLDDCTDLTIERPSTAMAHQRPRAVPQPMG